MQSSKQFHNRAIVIFGPTASGKTGFAHHLAKKYNGEVVNADSMQIYQQIPIITASPSLKLKNEISYHLYNFHSTEDDFSVIKYILLAAVIIREIIARGKLPIIVGGSGLYINTLLYGYHDLPEIDGNIRKEARSLHSKIGQEQFFKLLCQMDPLVQNKLKTEDSQRSIRAYEVVKQTGCSIFSFYHRQNISPLPDIVFENFFLLPERSFLHYLCNQRILEMFNCGAIEEVERVYKQQGDEIANGIKAIGAKEIVKYITGSISKNEALEIASAKTRQYAKRQITWFKHQVPQKVILEFSNLTEYQKLYDN